MFDKGISSRRPGKIGPAHGPNVERMSKAGLDRGTRCSFAAFILLAGIVQIFLARSISAQVAFKASLVLAAVRIVNSNALAATDELAPRRA